ncbi:MAG: hypothetical protein AAGA78_10520, partial [Pseudomonadota bacterium]
MSNLIKRPLLAAALVALATPVLAQDDITTPSVETVFILNSALFLMGGFLVFWMAAGFAMLEAGLVRSKNVTMQLTKNIALFSLASIFYYLIGYNLMYPLGSWSIGSDETGGYLGILFAPGVLEAVGVAAAEADDIGLVQSGDQGFGFEWLGDVVGGTG